MKFMKFNKSMCKDPYLGQENHRIIEWHGLGEIFRHHQNKTRFGSKPLYRQGHFTLDLVPHSPIQLDLEHFKGWGIYNFAGQTLEYY